MTSRFSRIALLILAMSFTFSVCAQEPLNRNWDAGKIKGVRNLPNPAYTGFPFLNDTWDLGKIQYTNGEIADSLYLRYSSFKDEVVYYDKPIATQIVIDKISLKGFSYTDKYGRNRVFWKLYYDGYMKGDRFFEVLSEGQTNLLAFRRVSLTGSSGYKDEGGFLKNLVYSNDYQFYFYSPEKGFTSVRINQAGLLAKFKKEMQMPIKRLLRKNKIRINGEERFIQAWKVVEKEGYKVIF
ncbi:MAG: hypothetical protein Q8N05_14470 [Bacteroidota bacterium]|nr:hypothetical protein [Bacteroidota bacterium]